MSSGSSHCAGLGFTPSTLSSAASCLVLKIPSSAKPRDTGHLQFLSSQSSFDKCFSHPFKLSTPFVTEQASILKIKSSLCGFRSVNSARSSLTLLPPLSRTLKIHCHTDSPDFCLNKLANSLNSLVVCVVHLLVAYTSYLSSRGLLSLRSGYRSRSNTGGP